MRLECVSCGVEEDLVIDEYNKYGNSPIYCRTCLEEKPWEYKEKHNEKN